MHTIRTLVALVALPLASSAMASSLSPTPALSSGGTLYMQACSYCHGNHGQGGLRQSAPKLWGSGNFVTDSAYGKVAPLSQFIRQYMPLQPVNGINPGSLSPAQAQDLARYILGSHHS
ncbi:MAG: c-type cytochrome [Thermaerobacter sp.]|nr:c-type cytochrome [Thermaerobacter sp.]